MTDADLTRRLSAIFSADAAGYSRLMAADEFDTIQTLEAHRKVFFELIETHHGRTVDSPGDNILAEFASVVDAVQCGVAVQKELARRNAELSEDRRMEFRIGINLGDVIARNERIYGDGVNIAARIEGLAEPRGICISTSVHEQVKNKFDIGFEYLGEHRVKNIAEPVSVYRIALEANTGRKIAGTGRQKTRANHAANQTVCIAVLPFENLSNQSEDEYFFRGFVEDLNTDLARFHNLQVIAFDTTRKIAAGPGSAVDAAAAFDIDYLLKGNLRRKSKQIRITTQLLAAANGRILWAERYDAPLGSIFEIQDQIVEQVAGAISAQIDKTLLAAARQKPITSLAAYDCWLRGMDHLRRGTLEADREARRIFKQALEIDPNYSRAYAGLSLSHFNEWSCQIWDQWEETGYRAYEYAVKAGELDNTDHIVQMILGRILLYRRRFDAAEQHLDSALVLNASDADCLAQTATSKAFLAKAVEGERLFQKALRLHPYHDSRYYTYGAFTYFVQRRYETFIQTALKGPLTDVWLDLPVYLAAAYGYLDRKSKAEHYLSVFMETFEEKITAGRQPRPAEVIHWLKTANPFKDEADTHHLIRGVAAAGLKAA